MKVYRGLEAFERVNNAVVTSGTFDGVHVGHQKILARLKEVAAANQGETMVITYWPHPRFVLYPDSSDLKLLSTLDEKIAMLDGMGIDHLLIIPFDKKFAALTSNDFIQNILVNQIRTKKLVIGYDHRFGRNREGSFEFLKANATSFGFEVEEIPKQEVEEVAVSSTKIRDALAEGNIITAESYLASPYTMQGEVVKGNQLGRKLGFPTANIHIPEPYKLVPANGIYAVKVKLGDRLLQGMLNIGFRPTVTQEKKRSIEVNLFDFQEDIYGKELTIVFYERLREEKKFESLEALTRQLTLDRENAWRVLNQS